MKPFAAAFAIACCFAVHAGAQSAPPAKYRISGVVVNGATQAPLARVRVAMNPATGSSKETETTTGADGRFAFEGLAAGMWTLHAERKGFPRQGYCERPGVPDSITQVVTGPGNVTEGLTFKLFPPAVLTGKVTDEAGEPVIAALEVILRLETGRPSFQHIRNVPTDEEGNYRIWDLAAGAYYLLAVTPMAQPTGPDQIPATLAPTYYSNSTDPQSATLIELKPGDEFKADFILRRSHGVSVHVAGATGSSMMMLSAVGPRGAEVVMGQLTPGEGESFFNVAPGRYSLKVFDPQTGAQSARTIEVGTGDLTVQLPFPDPSSITAKVRLVDGDAKLLANAAFYLHADGGFQTHYRALGKDTTVSIPGMAAGRYKFMLGGTRELYIKSIAGSNARVVDGIVDVPDSGEVKLDVVLSGDGGRVGGKAMANGKPVAPARVVLAPRADSTNSVDYRSYQTESDGSYQFTGIKPGDYILFATTDFRVEFGNPAAIRKHLAAGRPLHVAPKSSTDVQLEPLAF